MWNPSPRDVRELSPQVPIWMVRVLGRMLAKKPEQRYQTPSELMEDLRWREQSWGTWKGPLTWEKEETRPGSMGMEETPFPAPTLVDLPIRDGQGPQSPPRTLHDQPARVPPHEPGSLRSPTREQRRIAAGQFEAPIKCSRQATTTMPSRCSQLLQAGTRQAQDPRNAPAYPEGPAARTTAMAVAAPGLPPCLPCFACGWPVESATGSKVLEAGEEVLVHNPWHLAAQRHMANAASELGLSELARWLLEEARQQAPNDLALNRAGPLPRRPTRISPGRRLLGPGAQGRSQRHGGFQQRRDSTSREAIRRGLQ